MTAARDWSFSPALPTGTFETGTPSPRERVCIRSAPSSDRRTSETSKISPTSETLLLGSPPRHYPATQRPVNRPRAPQRPGVAQRSAILQPFSPGRAFKGLGVAKRYCRRDSIGDRFMHLRSTRSRATSAPSVTTETDIPGGSAGFVLPAPGRRPLDGRAEITIQRGGHLVMLSGQGHGALDQPPDGSRKGMAVFISIVKYLNDQWSSLFSQAASSQASSAREPLNSLTMPASRSAIPF